MPAIYIIHPQEELVECVASGEVNEADFRERQRALLHDPLFNPAFRQLLDLTKVTALGFSSDQVQDIAVTSVFGPEACRAIVAPSDLAFGLARMFDAFSAIAGRRTIMVFRSRTEALAWLDAAPKLAV